MLVADQQHRNHKVEVSYKFNNTPHIYDSFLSFKYDKNILSLFIIESKDFELSDRLISLLSENEKNRADRYYKPEDRHRFLVSRVVLRKLLAGYLHLLPEKISFGEGRNKKPFVEADQKVFFNISHTGTTSLIAVFRDEIGCDLEQVRPGMNFGEVMESVFSSEEIRFVQNAKAPLDWFYTLWTRKEALIKATSKGIDNDFRLLMSLDGVQITDTLLIGSEDNWTVESFRMDNFLCSFACRTVWQKQLMFIRLKGVLF